MIGFIDDLVLKFRKRTVQAGFGAALALTAAIATFPAVSEYTRYISFLEENRDISSRVLTTQEIVNHHDRLDDLRPNWWEVAGFLVSAGSLLYSGAGLTKKIVEEKRYGDSHLYRN